ncbi:MAG: GNAT family N-acetyltransferase [Cyanobacteria bacterium P01_F01_bin.153]
MLPQTIQTSRLQLRKPTLSDAEVLFDAYGQDPEVSKYMVWRPLRNQSEAEGFINQAVKDWDNQLRFAYVLATKEEQAPLMGMLDARIEGHVVDVGYVLARKYWGHGLMPEALIKLTAITLQQRSFFRIQATCDVDNHASIRTLEKCGFRNEGRLERHTIHPNISDAPRPCFMFARCK